MQSMRPSGRDIFARNWEHTVDISQEPRFMLNGGHCSCNPSNQAKPVLNMNFCTLFKFLFIIYNIKIYIIISYASKKKIKKK